MSLVIHRQDVDGKTGMTRFHVQVEEKDAEGKVTRGPVEHIAIYPQALKNIVGPGAKTPGEIKEALRRWMEPRHREMLMRKRHIEQVSQVAAELAGTTLEFD
jgi:hypothetical protein